MNPKLLVVDDHEATRTVLARLLTKRGYEVTTAASGAEAFKLAGCFRFDLVVMDHGLPDGDGCRYMKMIHRAHKLHGIALTANAYEADERKSRAAGFMHHLTKPVDVEKLCDVLAACTSAIKTKEASTSAARKTIRST